MCFIFPSPNCIDENSQYIYEFFYFYILHYHTSMHALFLSIYKKPYNPFCYKLLKSVILQVYTIYRILSKEIVGGPIIAGGRKSVGPPDTTVNFAHFLQQLLFLSILGKFLSITMTRMVRESRVIFSCTPAAFAHFRSRAMLCPRTDLCIKGAYGI